MSQGKNFGFDQDISQEWINDNAGSTGNKVLESGTYEFRIEKLTKKTSNGAKYKGCPMAELQLSHESALIFDWVLLNTDFKQKIANLLKAVFGDNNPPSGFWDKLEGETLVLEVEKYVDSWVNKEGHSVESFKNKIIKYISKGLDIEIGPNGKQPVNSPKVTLPSGEVTTKKELEGDDDLPF